MELNSTNYSLNQVVYSTLTENHWIVRSFQVECIHPSS